MAGEQFPALSRPELEALMIEAHAMTTAMAELLVEVQLQLARNPPTKAGRDAAVRMIAAGLDALAPGYEARINTLLSPAGGSTN